MMTCCRWRELSSTMHSHPPTAQPYALVALFDFRGRSRLDIQQSLPLNTAWD
jgi:hypothetical protein